MVEKFPILLYDDQCPLCVRFKTALEYMDKERKVTCVSLNEDELYQKFTFLSKALCKETIHLIINEKEALKGEKVISYLLPLFPGVKKLSWLLEKEAGKKAIKFFYDKANEIKKTLQQDCTNC